MFAAVTPGDIAASVTALLAVLGALVTLIRFLSRIEAKVDHVGQKLIDHMAEEERLRRSESDRVNGLQAQVDRMEGKLDALLAEVTRHAPQSPHTTC